MAATILALLGGLIRLAVNALDWMHSKQLIDAGAAQSQLESLKADHERAQKAIGVREAVCRDLARDTSRLRDDDGFRRDD